MGKSGKIFTSVLVWVFLIGTSLFCGVSSGLCGGSSLFTAAEYRIPEYYSIWEWGDDKKFYLLIFKKRIFRFGFATRLL